MWHRIMLNFIYFKKDQKSEEKIVQKDTGESSQCSQKYYDVG